jgi:hypothetical protein
LRQGGNVVEQRRELTGAAMHVTDRKYGFSVDAERRLAPFRDRERA